MTTNLRIKDREYDLEETFTNVPLNVLVFMTKRLGVTMKDIVGGIEQMNKKLSTASDDESESAVMMDILSTEAGLDAFRGLVWLSRTYAGERAPDGKFFTIDEASEGIGFGDFQFVNEPDPTELEASDPAGSPSTSTTSSATSPSTSSSSPTSGLATHS